jgi:hypothetical protein
LIIVSDWSRLLRANQYAFFVIVPPYRNVTPFSPRLRPSRAQQNKPARESMQDPAGSIDATPSMPATARV